MSALKFNIERPEDRQRKRMLLRIASYCSLGASVIIVLLLVIWYVGLDRLPPEVSLLSPENDFTTGNEKVSLNFNVTDNSEVDCEVFLNDAVIGKDKSLEATLKPGKNSWKVKCTDKSRYKNSATSKVRTINLLQPLSFNKINVAEASENKRGLLQIYEGTTKDDLGRLLIEILPNNGGLIMHNETSGKPLSISIWGENSLKSQKIKLNDLTVNLPTLNDLNSTFALYIDTEGNTYHSSADHKYLDGEQLDLNLADALKLEHRAN
ncbi:Ig-like domain-containing protein [Candidatus Woesearchaeota archaeon]|nr:Ig-like domain-containing protein [Candidatus Woesearchaeota archaeon]